VQDVLDTLTAVNQCQVKEMESSGKTLDPLKEGSCEVFSRHVANVESAIRHTYQVTAYLAVRESDPSIAAKMWMKMSAFCDDAIRVLRSLKDVYSHCGTSAVYDLALDYKLAADKRYVQNTEDAECPTAPTRLFPKPN
jgi:hypothetical protein